MIQIEFFDSSVEEQIQQRSQGQQTACHYQDAPGKRGEEQGDEHGDEWNDAHQTVG